MEAARALGVGIDIPKYEANEEAARFPWVSEEQLRSTIQGPGFSLAPFPEPKIQTKARSLTKSESPGIVVDIQMNEEDLLGNLRNKKEILDENDSSIENKANEGKASS